MNKKSVYQDPSLNSTLIVSALSLLMVFFSIYLTQHYFELKFPTGLESKSLCNLNQFFNCDKTTYSPLSNIAGVPISVFGIIIGLLTLLGLFFKNEKYERSIYFTLAVNFIGCVVLFFYSLFILKGLCPFCTLYYVASGLILFYFFKKSESCKPAIAPLAIFAVVTLVISGLFKINIDSKSKVQNELALDLINQYYSLPNLGAPAVLSPYKIASAPNAPIKMMIFSDFECPACRALSEMVPKIIERYAGKIEILYYFYPLDNNCNPSMDRPLHQFACQAAYTTTCFPESEFALRHDEIFHNQDRLASGFLTEYIKKHNIDKCVSDPVTKEKVVSLIQAAAPFNIRSTPTFLLNGVKIEGVLPTEQLFSIMDEILKRSGQ